MPIYEYECLNCGRNFEKIIFSKNEEINCTSCNSNKVRKRVSAFGMKTGEKFSSPSGSACNTCSSGNCSTCG